MPTPNGVNNLLQFLMTFEILPISKYKNQKWTFCLMSLCLLLCYHTQFCFYGLHIIIFPFFPIRVGQIFFSLLSEDGYIINSCAI